MIGEGDLPDDLIELADAEPCQPIAFPESPATIAVRIRALEPEADAVVQLYDPPWFREPGLTVLIAARPGRLYHDLLFLQSGPLPYYRVTRVERVYRSGAIDELDPSGNYPDDPVLARLVRAFEEEDR